MLPRIPSSLIAVIHEVMASVAGIEQRYIHTLENCSLFSGLLSASVVPMAYKGRCLPPTKLVSRD